MRANGSDSYNLPWFIPSLEVANDTKNMSTFMENGNNCLASTKGSDLNYFYIGRFASVYLFGGIRAVLMVVRNKTF